MDFEPTWVRRVKVPKFAKVIIGIVLGYGLLVFSFEVLLGIFQPQAGSVLTITTTGDDGAPNQRVLAWLDDEGTIYVSANHWPRAWYREAIAHPEVEVEIEGVESDYRVVPIQDPAEWARLDEKFAHPLAFKFITGFPPRLFLRLDPQGDIRGSRI
ncbi:MAG: hypothetical protein CBC48_11085 [bacterium TMED88]|nr:hypothetical protein [Deltaproteobacteria bacterium]OUV29982.1 MAG: hypothetical protein CBC48_11085 [bacterium TMED88]